MVFPGYMSFGGTEVINQARTKAYVDHAVPLLDLRECDGCEDFNEVVGDEPYQSPLVDQPDWFDDANPDSWDFYGLYPLSMEGFDDGVTTVTVTELMGPGAAVSMPRRASRQMRVTGLLVGRTDASIAYGMVWLRNALLGNPCDDSLSCTGDHLCYFTACPPVCEDSPDFPEEGNPGGTRACEDGLVIDPISECTAPYERFLYDVTLVDGPRIVEQYPSDCAEYVRVEFTLVAASPSPVGVLRRAVSPDSISRDPVLIPEISCTPDGGITERLNLIPSPKISTEPWDWQWGAQMSLDRYNIITAQAPPVETGTYNASLRDTVPAGTGQTLMSQLDEFGVHRDNGVANVPRIPGSPGMDVTASVWVRTSRMALATMWFDYINQAGQLIGQTPIGALAMNENEWGRLTLTFNAPEETAFLVGHVATNVTEGTAVAGNHTWWGAGMIEFGEVARTYFDGETTDTETMRFVWRGTPNQSTSEAQRVVDNLPIVVDPDCARIPPPPRAPGITDSCVDDPSQWRRYQYVLAPDLVPVWSDALPVVTLRAGGIAVRQVRIRFYPNPLGLDLSELEPCNFCGEFIVSYIPRSSTLTVDAIRQQAFITSPGGVVRAASHLLYSSDGGPMEWSSLSCGLEYTMTVDVVPTLITGLRTTMCLAARE